MRPFEYIRPASVAEAVGVISERGEDAFVLGGGSAAVVMLRLGVVRPELVVDLGGIEEMRGLSRNGGLRIGALVSIRSLELDDGVRGAYPLLAEAASQVANVRVRNVATVGGAVAYGEPQTDTPTALTASGAVVRVAGVSGERSVPISEFYVGPYETVLEQGEIVSGIDVPEEPPHTGGCHVKFTVGSPENKPVANASALVTVDPPSGTCVSARVVMGAAGPVPVVANAAGALVGIEATPERIADVAAEAAEEADPMEDLRGPEWYKRRILRIVVERALTCALQRART
ncbi:MAG: xanthine dehydrogenase family protein subunit M [Chloroflexota bacterium]|nr:xanthine dehydrogenase family protein subunit M [Chloroflexota bacterium]MDE2885558.1 xanthine dehydrogenase family protein subunit M [Chloroflexota bacterium]